jgi:antibiotic biosynthesis monooxygenase (ABM) superfamily enzyme
MGDPPLPKSESATQVITWNVIPGEEAAFEAWAHDMTNLATRQEGHMGAAWLRPDAPGGAYHVVFRFTTTELMERWMGSDERARMVAKLKGIATEQGRRQTGLETWFSLPGQTIVPPPKWKMALVTFAAVYPLSILFNWLVAPSVNGWFTVWRAALFPLALVPLLTFVVMPRLSRLLKHWLYGST